MRNKLSVISQQISMNSVDTLNLPRNSVHDAYILKFNITTSASGAASVTSKNILDAISEIKVVTDSTRVHYALTGYDLALRNSLIQKYGTDPFISQAAVSMASGDTHNYEFCLYLDEGDIIAVAHTNVELTVRFNSEVITNVTITAATATVTMKESIYSAAELTAVYGESFQLVAEPKVYALTKECPANTEFTGFLDLPTGTLLRGAMLWIEGTGTSSEGTLGFPTQVGILRTVPDRIELNKEDFPSHIELDQIIYGTPLPYDSTNKKAAYVMDFGTQWQSNGKGKNGWSFAKGDIQLAAKTAFPLKVRYISIESMVNTTVYDANVAFTEY